MPAEFLALEDAIARHVTDGCSVALEGFTHLIPFAAGHEIIRQGRRDLTAIRMTPDVVYDQMVGAGCVAKMVFSYSGNPGAGLLRRVRDAVENGWPHPLAIVEHSHAAMANAYEAGAAGLPCAVFRGYRGTDLPGVNDDIRTVACPFTGEELAAVPAIRPDVGVVHAQRADRAGNVEIEGIVGVQKECVLASRAAIVTVEEVVDDLRTHRGRAADGPTGSNSCTIPAWCIDAVCHVPGGAAPSYVTGHYARDNASYLEWDAIAADRERFTAWIEEHVMGGAPRA